MCCSSVVLSTDISSLREDVGTGMFPCQLLFANLSVFICPTTLFYLHLSPFSPDLSLPLPLGGGDTGVGHVFLPTAPCQLFYSPLPHSSAPSVTGCHFILTDKAFIICILQTIFMYSKTVNNYCLFSSFSHKSNTFSALKILNSSLPITRYLNFLCTSFSAFSIRLKR